MEIALLEAQVRQRREVVVLLGGPQHAVRDVVFVFGDVNVAAASAVEVDQVAPVCGSGRRNVLSRVGMPSDVAGLDGAAELGGEGGGHGWKGRAIARQRLCVDGGNFFWLSAGFTAP